MTMRASLVIQAKDQASASLARIAATARQLSNNARRISANAPTAANALTKLSAAATVLPGKLRVASSVALRFAGSMGLKAVEKAAYGAGYAIGFTMRSMAGFALGAAKVGVGLAAAFAGLTIGNMFKVGAEFEKFETMLQTATGSASAAKSAMSWVQKFAETTPYQLAEVTDAFVKLRMSQIDPADGTLRSLGDAAAATGKTLSDAAEMMQDAMSFQFERLLEFGVRATQQGDKVTFNWVKNGKAMTQTVRKDALVVKAALTGIFDGNYGGASAAQSRTMSGIVSNLKDKWTGFLKMIADAGIYDRVKTVLQQLLGWVERLSKNGKLQAWAKAISDQLTVMLNRAVDFVTKTDWGSVVQGLKSIAGAMITVVGWIVKGAEAWGKWQADIQRRQDQMIVNAGPQNAKTFLGIQVTDGISQRRYDEALGRLNGAKPAPRTVKRPPPVKWPSGPAVAPPMLRRSGKQAANDVRVGGDILLRIESAPGTKASVSHMASANRNVPLRVKTGRAMAGPA
ncbi:MAG: tape measure protein [Sphingobium sp.]